MLCPGLILTGMFDGISIAYPYLVPPLTINAVVHEIIASMRQTGGDGGQARHRSVWMPVTYYLPVLANILLPVAVSDWMKRVTGGNDGIGTNFAGRHGGTK